MYNSGCNGAIACPGFSQSNPVLQPDLTPPPPPPPSRFGPPPLGPDPSALGAIDGIFRLFAAHSSGCTDVRRNRHREGRDDPSCASFNDNWSNRHSSLRGVRSGHQWPCAALGGGRPALVATQDFLDLGLDRQFLGCSTICCRFPYPVSSVDMIARALQARARFTAVGRGVAV